LIDPAFALPLADGFAKATIPGGEVLRAQVERARIAAFAGHAAAAAAALVEQMYCLPGIVEGARSGEPRDPGSDDGDWSLAHDHLVCCCHQPHSEIAAQHGFMTSVR